MYLEVGLHCLVGRVFPEAGPGLSVQPPRPHEVALTSEDVRHLGQGHGGAVPVPRQLVLGHGPLIALHPALHIARAEQRPAAEETLLIKHRKYLNRTQAFTTYCILSYLNRVAKYLKGLMY